MILCDGNNGLGAHGMDVLHRCQPSRNRAGNAAF